MKVLRIAPRTLLNEELYQTGPSPQSSTMQRSVLIDGTIVDKLGLLSHNRLDSFARQRNVVKVACNEEHVEGFVVHDRLFDNTVDLRTPSRILASEWYQVVFQLLMTIEESFLYLCSRTMGS
jgi:hypothetical protein